MYAIGNIIYGSPITEKVSNWLEENCECPDEVYEESITIKYSGSASGLTGYVGVCLGSIDEAMDLLKLDLDNGIIKFKYHHGDTKQIRLVPTDEEKDQAQRMREALPQELQDVLEPIGIYISWSTS